MSRSFLDFESRFSGLSDWWVIAAIFLAILSLSPPLSADDDLEKGRELAQRVYDRPEGNDLTTRGVMLLEEEGRSPRTREMITYQLTREPGEVWSLIRFTAPADIAGTGLLTLDYPNGSSDQWVYLPAMDRTRRIPATRRGGRFVGSDLYFEDVQDRKPDMDIHRFRGEDTIQGVTALKLESVPVDVGNSAYGRRVSWIHEPSLLPLRIDFYAPGQLEQPVKRMEIQRIDRIQGYWTVMDSTMTDLRSGHRTRLRVDDAVYDRELPESLFSSRVLEDSTLESRYRP